MTLTDNEVEAIIDDIKHCKSDKPTNKLWILPSGAVVYLDERRHHGSILFSDLRNTGNLEYNTFWRSTIDLKKYGAFRIYISLSPTTNFQIAAYRWTTPNDAQIAKLKEIFSKRKYDSLTYDIYYGSDAASCISNEINNPTLLSLQKFLRRLEEMK